MSRTRSQHGKAARRLLMLADDPPSLDAAVDIVASRLLDGVVCPPTDLDALLPRLNVRSCRADDGLQGSGMLAQDGDGLAIVFSPHQPAARIRFTIAHELAHAVFEATGPGCPRRGQQVERLCDRLATELLMPRRQFRQAVPAEPGIDDIAAGARVFGTSLVATALRCAQLHGVSVFEVREGRIHSGHGVIRKGRPFEADARFRASLDTAMRGESGAQEVALDVTGSLILYEMTWRAVGRSRAMFCLRRVGRRQPQVRRPAGG